VYLINRIRIIVHDMTHFCVIFFVECRKKLIKVLLIHDVDSLRKKE